MLGMRPRVAISACLVGEKVRWDGRAKEEPGLVAALARDVELVPLCPEVELGLGVPRPPIRLAVDARSDAGTIRLVTVAGDRDLTSAMDAFARARIEALVASRVDGYVWKSGSPSCGLDGVARFAVGAAADATPIDRAGRGRFAALLVERCPYLPVAEERALDGDEAIAAFLARVRSHARRR